MYTHWVLGKKKVLCGYQRINGREGEGEGEGEGEKEREMEERRGGGRERDDK